MVLISPPEGWVLTEEPPVAARQGSAQPRSRRPLRRMGILLSVVGVPVARETASEKPAVEPPPIQLPDECRLRKSPRRLCCPRPSRAARLCAGCTAERQSLTVAAPAAAAGGCAAGLYAFRTAGSCCRRDVPVVADAIALGSRGRAGGFRSAGFGGSAGGLDGRVQSPPRRESEAQRRDVVDAVRPIRRPTPMPSRRCRSRSSIAVGCPSKPCC